ncbi:hypothetical protein [Corynebacterium sp. Marseille-P4321]|uniref:hypothetical protein n=1 Tax=Corynebacterium sp. Marseille-P4321 TaxID=2736603 RepID=UPI0009E57346|nr:hypothetical protein [Corynebacterium sp. Marseille-P4321]
MEGNGVRQRRRAARKSPVDYDRQADRPAKDASISNSSLDSVRDVVLDDDAEEALTGREFYEAERPPHYGD